MVVPSPSSSKAQLRAEGLRRRRAFAATLTAETRSRIERQLAERLLPHLEGAEIIAAYHPLLDEISPYPLLDLVGASRRIAFPWFADRDSRMMWREGPASEAGPWGILQPEAQAPAVAPDLVIVPLVLADRRGTRIGHGKGHYDRALGHLRAAGAVRAIGIGWDDQLTDDLIPADPWDIPLDSIATPAEWVQVR